MSETCTLHILHTNDLHSNFERMPQIATCIQENRALWESRGDHVLVVDIGDHVDRSRMKTEATWGQANIEILNASGYQYVTIGNNEGVTLPKERLDQLYHRANFTVVLSNLVDPETGEHPDWCVPYVVHEWDGFRVAILGVTVPFETFYQLLGWKVLEPFAGIQKQVNQLRSEVDAIIVMSHLGYWADKKMADEVAGIDVILGAHTHHLLEKGERVGGTLIAQVGKHGEFVGHVELTVDRLAHCVRKSKATLIQSGEYSPSPRVVTVIEREQRYAEQRLSESVGWLSRELPIDWKRESPLGSLLAASVRNWTKAEIGLVNNGLLLTPLLPGEITRKDLLACLPHPIKPCAVTLTGEQLMKILTRALMPELIGKELRGFGFRGKILGWMAIDGATVHYHPDNGIEQVWINGKPCQPEREYRVGTVDMFMLGELFPEFHKGQATRFYLPEVLREVMAEAVHQQHLIDSCFSPRWVVVS